MLETIFSHQRTLMNRYHEIEEKNVGYPIPFSVDEHGPFCGALNFDDRASQLRFKDFAWRITEELTEATLSLGEEDRTHYEEELIDALHFSVELLILCGFRPKDFHGEFVPGNDSLTRLFLYNERRGVYPVIEKLGEAMNRLKLKPWKTTAMLTDKAAFRNSLGDFFVLFIGLLAEAGFTPRTATAMYLNKNAVNQFRQNSAY